MTALEVQPTRWSRRRWLTTIGVVMAGQVILIFLVSNRVAPRPSHPTQRNRFEMVTEPAAQQRLGELPWLDDPARFALVSQHGFSGPIWLSLPRFQHQAMEWSEPPRWLTQDVSRLGAAFAFAPGAGTPSPVASEKPPASFGGLPAFTTPIITNSTLRVEGPIARRRLLTPFDLPAWPHTDILLPTLVQVVVDPQGTVVSAILMGGASLLGGGSGLAAADRRALELARAARFEPFAPDATNSGLTWGVMMFQWQVVTPPKTPPPAPSTP